MKSDKRIDVKNLNELVKKFPWKVFIGLFTVTAGVFLGVFFAQKSMRKVNSSLAEQIARAMSEHRYGEAYYLLNKAIEKDPTNADYYIIEANLLKEKGRIDDAISVLNTGLSKGADQLKIYESLWPIYETKGDYVKTAECIKNLLGASLAANSSLSLKYRYKLARVYIKMGKLDDAEMQLSSIVSTGDRSQESFFSAARDLALWEIEDQPTRDSLLSLAAEGEEQVKADVKKIKEQFVNKADEAKRSGDEARYYGWLAGAQLTFDLCPLSHKLFEKSIEIGDRFGIYRDAHKNYAICLYKEGSYDKALEQINLSIQADPIDLESWIYKANICSAKGDFHCADESYVKVFTVGTSNTEWYNDYCEYLHERGQTNKMLECIDKLYSLSIDEQEKRSIANKAVRRAVLSNVDTSVVESWLGRMDQSSVDFFIFSGWVGLKKGQISEAKSETLKALSIDPYNSWAAYQLAVIYKMNGDKLQAINWAVKAIDYDLTGEITNLASELLKTLNGVV